MMRPTTVQRISEAYWTAGSLLKIGYSPAEVISELVNDHRAMHGHYNHSGYYLRCATVEVTTPSMVERDLLFRWLDRAANVLAAQPVAA